MRAHSTALIYNNANAFNKILKNPSPIARLDDIKYTRIKIGEDTLEEDTLSIAQYCVAHRCDDALTSLFTCERTGLIQEKCSKNTQICRIHELFFNQTKALDIFSLENEEGLHIFENKDGKNLLEEMALQGERLAKQREDFVILLTQVLSKDDTIEEIKKCLKTTPLLVKWMDCAEEKYYPGQAIIFLLMSLVLGLLVNGFDFYTDTKVTIKYGIYSNSSHLNEVSKTTTVPMNISFDSTCDSIDTEWNRFSSFTWSTLQSISIFHLAFPFVLFFLCGIWKIGRKWKRGIYKLNQHRSDEESPLNEEMQKNAELSWLDTKYGFRAVIRDVALDTIFSPLYSKVQVYRSQKKIIDYKSNNPTQLIDPQELGDLEKNKRKWKMRDQIGYLIEIACEVSFQLYLQTGLIFSSVVYSVVNRDGSTELNPIDQISEVNLIDQITEFKDQIWSFLPSDYIISIISSIYSLTKAFLTSKKLQKLGAQDWKAQLALFLSLLFEISSRVCCISFFLHFIDKDGRYRWDVGIVIYYGHILLVICFNMVFINIPRYSDRLPYIRKHLPTILLNSFCSFFTYPGFNLDEATRGHFPSFMKQSLFYSLIFTENLIFMIVGFQFGYGKLMRSNGDTLTQEKHLTPENMIFFQITISAFLVLFVVFRVIYYKLHPAKPKVKPSLELQIIFGKKKKREQEKREQEKKVYCPQEHLMDKFSTKSRPAGCRNCGYIEGNYYVCDPCLFDICQNCVNKYEELDCNVEDQNTFPDDSANETKETEESTDTIKNPNPLNETKESPDVENTNSSNKTKESPDVENRNSSNETKESPDVENPNSSNATKESPDVENPNSSNKTKESPNVENQDPPDDAKHPNSTECKTDADNLDSTNYTDVQVKMREVTSLINL